MIFRRIKAHVEKENWFAVFIDFCIVVVGVFIGIQVANWNEARTDAERSERIQARLAAEFTEIETDSWRTINDIIEWQSASRSLTEEVLEGTVTSSRTDLFELLDQAVSWIQPTGTSATYHELLNSGDVDLLNSDELQEALLEFNVVAERHIDSNLVLVDAIKDDWKKLNRLTALLSIPSDQRPTDFSEKLESDLDLPEIYIAISYINQMREIDLAWHRGTQSRACDVLRALDQPCADVPDNNDPVTVP